jgi:aminoglycoside phosphotransferase (APT) family kinase protein
VMAKAEIEWADGVRETVVLRGDPPPEKTMLVTDRDAEWAVLQFLASAPDMPMPRPLHYDGAASHLGTKAILLEFCAGPSLQAEISALGGPFRATDPQFVAHRDAFVDSMAKVPQVPLSTLPAEIARPNSWDAYMTEKNRAWADVERSLADSNPAMRYLAAWLEAHRPPPMDLALQHGDFQPANILLEPSDGSHRVIDWEYAHIGDPREDLGWYMVYSASSGPSMFDPDPEGFLARYRSRTGASELCVNQATVGYFSVVSAVKVFGQLVQAMDAMGKGAVGGVMTTYNINAASVGHMNFLGACAALAEPLDMMRAAYEQMAAAGGAQ